MNQSFHDVSKPVLIITREENTTNWFHYLLGARYPKRRDGGCVDGWWGRLRRPGPFPIQYPIGGGTQMNLRKRQNMEGDQSNDNRTSRLF
jgi:hypothetical protein